jgi:pilus assembly protein CpaB
MNRKLLGIALAVVLALVGTVALVGYVQSAKDEAVAGEVQVEAYVLTKGVNKGASVNTVSESVELTEVPAKVRPDDAVTDLDDLDEDLAAGVDLAPGELLLRSRLVRRDQLTRAQVPDGLQELTVALTPERAVGGSLRAGDTVGIVLSFDPFDISGDGQGGENADKTPNMSHLTFHKVLVTGVQFDENDENTAASDGDDGGDGGDGGDESEESADRAPNNELLVTLALSSPQVERVVFTAEFGFIWLTAEPEDATEDGTEVVTLDKVYGQAVIPGAGGQP